MLRSHGPGPYLFPALRETSSSSIPSSDLCHMRHPRQAQSRAEKAKAQRTKKIHSQQLLTGTVALTGQTRRQGIYLNCGGTISQSARKETPLCGTPWQRTSIPFLKTREFPSYRTGTQCKARIKYLQDEHKRVKDHNFRNVNNRESFEYYDEIDEVLGSKPNITHKEVVKCGLAEDANATAVGDSEASPEITKAAMQTWNRSSKRT